MGSQGKVLKVKVGVGPGGGSTKSSDQGKVPVVIVLESPDFWVSVTMIGSGWPVMYVW